MTKHLRYLCTLLLFMVASVGWGDVYQKYSGEITEGEYLICYSSYAMKSVIASSRFSYYQIGSNELETHTTTDASLVWKIEKNGDYYTLYNESVNQYAASTGAANKAKLESSVTDNSLWTISGNSTYEFVNKANAAKNVNANLRNNGTYGFACYSTTTGGPLTLYKKVENSDAITTITTIDATGITNTDIHEGTAAGQLSASVTANGTAIAGATVTWESSNEDCATIDANGIVTLVAAGTTTITATYAGVDNQYLPSSATYSLTVTDSTPFSGGDVTFDATQDKGTSPLFKNGVSFACDNGVLNNGTEYRLYKNSTTTFSVSEGVITQITFTGVSSNPASGFATQTGWTTDENNGTWTGNAQSVSFTASDAQVRATQIVVTVDMNATPDPIINASDVNIAYDATSGSIAYTIGNPVAGTSLRAAVTGGNEGNWLTLGEVGESSVLFTSSANETTEPRTATVTLTYDEVTKEVIVTQAAAPLIYTTIPALFAAATSTETDVTITFGNWVVSGVSTNGKNIFVTDNNGNGFVIYYGSDMSSTFSAGNILSGTVSCKLKKYNGFAELVNLNADDLTITDGGSVTTSSIAMADLAGVNTGALVSYENLTCSVDNNKYYLTDGTTTIQVYNSLYAFNALEAGKTYNITGVYQQYNTTKEVMPRSAADIVEVEVPVQTTITAGTLSHVAISSLYDGDMEDITLGDNVTEGTLVYFTLSVDEGYNLESVTVLNANNEEVTLTENQGSWSFTMPNSSVTINATATAPAVEKTLSNANIVAAGDGDTGYKDWSITDNNEKVWNAYAIKNQHSNATSAYHFLQIKKYASNTAYYLQVPEYGTKITKIEMTVSSSSKPMTDGGNTATLYFSAENSTSAAGEGVSSGTGASTVTIDCSGLNLNTGYITASGSVRIWDVTVTYEEATSETVTVSVNALATDGNKFYSTLYYGDKNLKIPAGITASGVSLNGKKLVKTEALGENAVIGKGTAVLLTADEAKDYEFTVVTDDGSTLLGDNMLCGNDEDAQTTGGGVYYQLSRNANKDANSIGFYWGAANGGAFNNKAHRAYLVVPAEQAKGITGFAFGDMTDGIEAINNSQSTTDKVYNLAGQRVNKSQKGIYIVNGKKVVVK